MLRRLFISALMVAIPLAAISQEKADNKEPFIASSGLAVGIDFAPIIISFFNPDKKGMTFTGRINLKQKVFGVLELGYEKADFDKEKYFEPSPDNSISNYFDGRLSYQYAYLSNGTFIKPGIDINLFKVDETNNRDNVLFGIRYGFAAQQHQSPKFSIGNGYWPDYENRASLSSSNTHWVELLFGIRTEIFKNIYMGWSMRTSRIVSQNNATKLEPAYIPGFGKYRGKMNASFSYTLEYQLPFSKKSK